MRCFQRAVMGRLGDAEEVVIVAALLAGVLDHRGIAGAVERDEVDPADVFVEAIFERADAGFGVVRDLSSPRAGGAGDGGRAHQVVEREHAAAMELNQAGLQALGAPVLEVGLDRLDVTLVVVHVAVRRLRAVIHSFSPPAR